MDTAFPLDGYYAASAIDNEATGLTKREYYAAKAMQALIANPNIRRPQDSDCREKELKEFSEVAVEYADALIEALKK